MRRTRRAWLWIVLATAWNSLFVACQVADKDITTLASGEVAIASIQPSDDRLSPGQPIRLTFSRAVAPAETELNVYIESPPASITPAVAGFWKWSEPSVLEFVPDEDYRAATSYVIEVDGNVATSAGLKLKGRRKFTLLAEGLRVREFQLFVEPVAGMKRTYRIKGSVSFNHLVDPHAFAEALRIDLARRGKTEVEVEVETHELSRTQAFQSVPIEAGEKDEEITAVVSARLQPAHGDAPLGTDASSTTVVPSFRRLAVHSVQPDAERDRRVVSVRFSDEVDADEFLAHAHLEPVVPNLSVDMRGNIAIIRGDWEASRRYTLRLDESLTSENGIQLERDYQGSIFFGDLPETLEIAGAGNYLSIRGDRKIGIETTNIAKLALELDRVYANNIVPFLQEGNLTGYRYDYRLQQHGKRIFSRELQVASDERNHRVLTALDLDETLRDDSRGIFLLTVHHADRRYMQASKLVIATDLGIVAKRSPSQLLVAIVSIADLTPLAGVTVEVLSFNNQVLASRRTDASGLVSFTNLEPEDLQNDAGERPFVITARMGDDLGFLSFADTRTPTGDLDVGGITRPGSGYQVFVYSERGIYRPGDSARLAWITRDANLSIPAEFPMTLQVTAPDARVFAEERVSTGAHGMAEFALDIPEWAPTGTYFVNLQLTPERTLGSTTLKVEDFIPDRMKVDVELRVAGEPKRIVRPGEELELHVAAISLFGPPAAGRDAKASLRIVPASVEFPDWRGYTFGDSDEKIDVRAIPLGMQKTGDDGQTIWSVEVPKFDDYHGWLRAEAEVEVSELGGGRAIGGRRSIVISPATHFVGLKRGGDRTSDYEEPQRPIAFDVVLVDLDGHAQASSTAIASVYRRKWRTILGKDAEGRYRYVSEYDEDRVETRSLSLAAGANAVEFSVDRHGSYRLQIEDPSTGAKSSLLFYVYGAGYAPWAMSAPETVALKLDRDVYAPGDIAKVQIEAPFAGLVLLTVEREQVFRKQWLRLDSNSAVVEIPLDESLQPNCYVVATLLRPLDSVEVHAPARAFGATPVFMTRAPATLPIELDAPAVMRPRNKLPVRVRIPGAAEQTMLTLAAVDEGILQITEFATPSPLDFYFQRCRLSVESHDIWSLLLPEFRVLAPSATGGDAEIRRKNLNPISVRRVAPVALWSGVLAATGNWQTVELDVPEFNGALRVMAVAAGDRKFGSAEAITRVRDPIVLSPNLPRFLAPGDEFSVPVQVYNGIDEAAGRSLDINVQTQLTGPVRIAAGREARLSLTVPGGKEGVAVFQAQALDSIGTASFNVSALASGERVWVHTEMAVRPPRPFEVRVHNGALRGGETQRVALDSDFYAAASTTKVAISPLPVAQVAAGLAYLLRYPYGCIEQTTSSCFPLLYFAEIAREVAPEVFGETDALYFLNSGIDRIVAMHVAGGRFSYWPGGTVANSNPWASVYATHFLVEARRKNVVVPDRVLNESLDYLARIARTSEGPEFQRWSTGHIQSVRGYAMYVLALAGRPEKGAMEKLRHERLDQALPSVRYHLAGAYGLAGNRDMMHDLLPVSVTEGPPQRQTGNTWYSAARDDAIMLDVLATVEPEHRHVPELLRKLLEATKDGRWSNTQENGWAYLALGKLFASGGTTDVEGEVVLNGTVIGSFDRNGVVLTGGAAWSGQEVEIRARGTGMAYWSIMQEGVPRGREDRDITDGLVVTREYRTLEGNPIDLHEIPQGQVIVARLSLASRVGRVENVVVADLVPAGLEIENPRLMTRGGVSWGHNAPALPIEYLDIRDDRLLLFTQADQTERVFLYTLRAVTQGRFILPPVKAEAMYDAAVTSIRGAGDIRVVAPK